MRELTYSDILVYYDEPELVAAYDQIGGLYVCSLVEKKDNVDTFLCIPTSKERYKNFVNGDIDLLTLIDTVEIGETYVGTVTDGNLENIKISLIPRNEIPDKWLPETGFHIKPQEVFGTQVVKESHKRQHAVLYFTLDPPEAANESKIFAERLIQGVRLIQRVITYAYRNAISSIENKDLRNIISDPNNYKLEVLGSSPGSFTLQMQTVTPADLFGYAQIARALNIIDEINDKVDNPDEAVKTIATHGGHFTTAYRDMLQFIIQNDTSMSYEWSMPSSKSSKQRRVTNIKAEPIYEALIEQVELGKERKIIIGTLTKANIHNGTWGIFSDEEKKEYSGESANKNLVSGLKIEGRYKFNCEEQLAEERGTGKEIIKFILESYDPVQ